MHWAGSKLRDWYFRDDERIVVILLERPLAIHNELPKHRGCILKSPSWIRAFDGIDDGSSAVSRDTADFCNRGATLGSRFA
jgi:hypothetical protein